MTAEVTNCVAPHASDTRSRTGSAKNARQVDQNGTLGGERLVAACGRSSRLPRTGSRTNDHTSARRDDAPRLRGDTKADRQLYGRDGRAEGDAERLPDWRSQVEEAERGAPHAEEERRPQMIA